MAPAGPQSHPAGNAPPHSTARIYHATVSHRRNSNAPGAVTRRFSYSSYFWLVDVDDLPVLPAPAATLSRDFGRAITWATRTARSPTTHGHCSPGTISTADRILLLTCPRVAGHVFNPLSVFYCLSGDGETWWR